MAETSDISPRSPATRFDIVVVGAGPAGLCFARSLADSGLRIALVERQSRAALAEPAEDGREIALTHRSQRLMADLGLWARLAEDEISTLRDALVLDGDDIDGLRFRHEDSGRDQLGWLVPNHAIRRTAFAEAMASADVTLFDGRNVTGVRTASDGAEVRLDDGGTLACDLIVAADSRFSETRRAMGIGADMRDFGRTMLVCRVRHERDHEQTAWEWFDYGQTLALLPLRDRHASSVVLTLPHAEAAAVQAQDPEAFGADMTRRFRGRLGAMTFTGPCCAYPLVGVYPRKFAAERFVAIGDAAVGMHPVTAHGFNFGLLGQDTLAKAIRSACAAGRPYWTPALLADYERAHRRATRPLYLATQWLTGLYTDERAPAKRLRRAALRAATTFAPFRRLVAAGLVDDGRGPPLPGFLTRLRPAR